MLIIVMYQDIIQEIRQYEECEELEGYFEIKTLKPNKDYRIIQLKEEKKREESNYEPVDWKTPKFISPTKKRRTNPPSCGPHFVRPLYFDSEIFFAIKRKEVNKMQTQQISQWKGSLNTAEHVRQEIALRWGIEEAEKYNPLTNCFTFQAWLEKGYSVKKGETAIRSYTLKEVTEEENGKPVKRRYFKTCYLFFYLQVEKR